MFKLFKSSASATVKSTHSKAGVTNVFDEINNAKIMSQAKHEVKDDHYTDLFNKGLDYLRKFALNDNLTQDKNLLHEAAILFTKAIEIKSTKAEPYFYMAYIFYFMKEISYSLKYIKVVTYIAPEFPGLDELVEKVLSYQDSNLKNTQAQENVQTQVHFNYPKKNIQTSQNNSQLPIRQVQRICLG